MCQEFSQCYDDINICLWTDGSVLTWQNAKSACQQRNNNFLPRITDSSIQSKLAEFRRLAGDLLFGKGFWIDVTVANSGFHWIDDSPLAGWFVSIQRTHTDREKYGQPRVDIMANKSKCFSADCNALKPVAFCLGFARFDLLCECRNTFKIYKL